MNKKEQICDICGIFSKAIYRHKIKCQKIQYILKKYKFTQDIVQKEYTALGSVLEFQRKYSELSRGDCYLLFKHLDIKYSLKQSSNSKNTLEKRKETLTEKTGYHHNFCKNSPSRKKWEKRLKKEEGITNVFQRESVKKKSVETIIRKYGDIKYTRMKFNTGASVSVLNKMLYDILNKCNIKYQAEFVIKAPKPHRFFRYDVRISDTKLIEINGDYWHGNPRLYKSSDIILKGSSKEFLVRDKWKKDRKKGKIANAAGYEVLVIWEYDIKNHTKETIKRIINYAKSKNQKHKKIRKSVR